MRLGAASHYRAVDADTCRATSNVEEEKGVGLENISVEELSLTNLWRSIVRCTGLQSTSDVKMNRK